jgi:ribosome-binding protein aMBF1 (putative translation factor)
MSKELLITKKINLILDQKNLSSYKLAKMIDYPDSGICSMIQGRQTFSKKVIKKILPILEVSREEFESWILADKYPKEILERAIQIKKEFPYKRKSVLTINIDKILEEKGMSRTALAKQINYSQSSVNAMITGKLNMSKTVMERISQTLKIPQNEILSWIVADRYKLESLKNAYEY